MRLYLTALIGQTLVKYPVNTRQFHYTFKRILTPPMPQPKESPYIVGPYLKPDYIEQKYLTDPIREKVDDDLEHFIYEPTKVEPDESRTVKLLLIEDVEGLGVAGQVVDAPYRLGASRLIAMKKAEYATDFAHKWYKFGPKTFQSASSALSPRTARLLRTRIYDLPVARNTVVKPWHISLALRLQGCICPIEAIEEESISDCIVDDLELVKCIVKINNHERIEAKFTYSKVIEKEE